MAAELEAVTASAAPDVHANGVGGEAGGVTAKLTAAQKRRVRLKQSKAAKQAIRYDALHGAWVVTVVPCTVDVSPAAISAAAESPFVTLAVQGVKCTATGRGQRQRAGQCFDVVCLLR